MQNFTSASSLKYGVLLKVSKVALTSPIKWAEAYIIDGVGRRRLPDFLFASTANTKMKCSGSVTQLTQVSVSGAAGIIHTASCDAPGKRSGETVWMFYKVWVGLSFLFYYLLLLFAGKLSTMAQYPEMF